MKMKLPKTASPPTVEELTELTNKKLIKWDNVGGKLFAFAVTSGWTFVIEDNFLWATSEMSFIPMGSAANLLQIIT